VAVLLLAACAASVPSGPQTGPHQAPATASDSGITDPSYDWHVLLPVAFGTLLKESPLPLHEVLLFHDGSADAAGDNKDCFSTGTAPRFLGQSPDPYELCFDHDRLQRVDASVRLPAGEAPQVFARACALWLKSTASTMTSATSCAGRDGDIAFAARLLRSPDDDAAVVSMMLTGASIREAVDDAPAAR
jgi:hypothetical protein